MVERGAEVDHGSAGPGATSVAQPRLRLSSVLPAPDCRQRKGGLAINWSCPPLVAVRFRTGDHCQGSALSLDTDLPKANPGGSAKELLAERAGKRLCGPLSPNGFTEPRWNLIDR